MNNLLIAIVGEDNDVFEIIEMGLEYYFPQQVILLYKENRSNKLDKVMKRLNKAGIMDIVIKQITKNPTLEEVFIEIKQISKNYSDKNIVINVDTDYYTSCISLSSAFVSGIQAIGILKDKIISYPIMKFSYYNAINDKKMEILKHLDSEEFDSMEKLAKKSNMSLPLIAYHVRGNRDSKGLEEMKLVETNKIENSVNIKLTDLGKLLVKGHIDIS